MMDGYFTLLATKHTMRNHPVMQLHSRYLTSVLSGRYMIEVSGSRDKKLAFTYDTYPERFRKASVLIGAFNKGGNHWVYVHIDVVNMIIRYLDPKKYSPPVNLLQNWNCFWRRFHCEVTHREVVRDFKLITLSTAVQGPKDNTNCGVYCLSVHFFIKSINIA